MSSLTLKFENKKTPQLTGTQFVPTPYDNVHTARPLITGLNDFQWRKGTMALAVFVLKARAWHLRQKRPSATGPFMLDDDIGAILYDAIRRRRQSLLVQWPIVIFGLDSKREPMISRIIATDKTRHVRKATLQSEELDPTDIGIFLNEKDISDDLAHLEALASEILAHPPLQVRSQVSESAPVPPEPFCAHRHPLQRPFIGRTAERGLLSNWLTRESDPVLLLTEIGGMGKSSLAWVWVHEDVLGEPVSTNIPGRCESSTTLTVQAQDRPEGMFWWSFCDRDADFAEFLDKALLYVTAGRANLAKLNSEDKLNEFFNLVPRRRFLFVLDGLERELSAYKLTDRDNENASYPASGFLNWDNPLVAKFLQAASSPPSRSKVLLTTRNPPRELESAEGCQVVSLPPLDADGAVELFRALDIRGTRSEILEVCRPYDFHPLSLRLLAGVARKSRQTPRDVSAVHPHSANAKLQDRDGLDIFRIAYDSMCEEYRLVLSRIATTRGPVPYEALALLHDFGTGEQLDNALNELTDRGLLLSDHQTDLYDLHPLIREYAYNRLSESHRRRSHASLFTYYGRFEPINPPRTIGDLAPAIERCYHATQIGKYQDAYSIIRDDLFIPLHHTFATYGLNIQLLRALFPKGEEQPPALGEGSGQRNARPIVSGTAFSSGSVPENPSAWASTALGLSYRVKGWPRKAIGLLEEAAKAYRESGGIEYYAALINLADVQWTLGQFKEVEISLRDLIEQATETGEKEFEVVGYQDRGLRRACRGQMREADADFACALDRCTTPHREAIILAHKARKELLCFWAAKEGTTKAKGHARMALEAADRSLGLLDVSRRERHFVRARWLVGASQLALGDLDHAGDALLEALRECRRIDLVEFEADILLDVARLFRAKAARLEKHAESSEIAQERANEALEYAMRHGYVLAEVDAHVLLAELAQQRGDLNTVESHATKARELAICGGEPHFTYKVPFEKARALLLKSTMR